MTIKGGGAGNWFLFREDTWLKRRRRRRRRWGGENELSHSNRNLIVSQEEEEEEEEEFLFGKWVKRVQVLIWILNQNLWHFGGSDLRQCVTAGIRCSHNSTVTEHTTPRSAGGFSFVRLSLTQVFTLSIDFFL